MPAIERQTNKWKEGIMFTMSNTDGYDFMDIDTMNTILKSRMKGHNTDDPNHNQIEKMESERVLREYGQAMADSTVYMLPETGAVGTRVDWYYETGDGEVKNAVDEWDLVAVVWDAKEQCWAENAVKDANAKGALSHD